MLDEMIVTGTAAPTSRRALGNSVATVDAADITQSQALTIDQALQGKVAGAVITSNTGTPGGGVSIRLRGTSSITGGAEPLYIVDGVIIDNNADEQINFGYRSNPANRLADLDPADIERIEILKGAAAAALYGSRANNGVVQIFTKRGQAGRPQFTVSSRMGRSDLERRIDFALTPRNARRHRGRCATTTRTCCSARASRATCTSRVGRRAGHALLPLGQLRRAGRASCGAPRTTS